MSEIFKVIKKCGHEGPRTMRDDEQQWRCADCGQLVDRIEQVTE